MPSLIRLASEIKGQSHFLQSKDEKYDKSAVRENGAMVKLGLQALVFLYHK